MNYCCPINAKVGLNPLQFNEFKQKYGFQALMCVCVRAIFLFQLPLADFPSWQTMTPPSLFRDAQGIPARQCST